MKKLCLTYIIALGALTACQTGNTVYNRGIGIYPGNPAEDRHVVVPLRMRGILKGMLRGNGWGKEVICKC